MLMPVPRVEVDREKTSLVAVEVETLFNKFTGRLKVMSEGEVEVVTAKTLPAVVVFRPTEPVNNPREVTPAPPQALPVVVNKPPLAAWTQLPEVKFWADRVLTVVEPMLLTER